MKVRDSDARARVMQITIHVARTCGELDKDLLAKARWRIEYELRFECELWHDSAHYDMVLAVRTNTEMLETHYKQVRAVIEFYFRPGYRDNRCQATARHGHDTSRCDIALDPDGTCPNATRHH